MRMIIAEPAGPTSFRRYAQALIQAFDPHGLQPVSASRWPRPHLFWNPYGGWGEPAVLSDNPRLPMVITFHGGAGWSKPLERVYGIPPTEALQQWALQQRTHWEPVLRRASAILLPSSYGKEELLDLFALADERLHVVPLGHDPQTFRPQGPRTDAIGFLHVSSGGPVKRVGSLLEAYALLHPPKPPLTLILPRERWPDLPQPGVNLLLPINDDARLAEIYRGALALIQPSAWETFGLPALEAAACATPAIVSDNSAPAQIWKGHALLLRNDTASELACAMRSMMDAPTRALWSTLALERAQTLTWKACATQTEEIFRHVINRRSVWRFAPWRH